MKKRYLTLLIFIVFAGTLTAQTVSVSNMDVYWLFSASDKSLCDEDFNVIWETENGPQLIVGSVRRAKLSFSLPREINNSNLFDPSAFGAYDVTPDLKITFCEPNCSLRLDRRDDSTQVEFIYLNKDGEFTIGGMTLVGKRGWNILCNGQRIDNLNILYQMGYKWYTYAPN